HGQLAWDLHEWLSSRLSAAQQAVVEQAQRRALARLPALARRAAEATPVGLGWPAPTLAESMALRFAALVGDARAAALDRLQSSRDPAVMAALVFTRWAEPDSPSINSDAERLSILVVDDDRAFCAALAGALRRRGH